MTHLEELQASTDGPIPEAAYRVAREKDLAAERRRGRVARTLVRIKSYKAAGMVEAMARALVRTRRLRGEATRMDLHRLGFRLEEIERFGNDAVARAAVMWQGAGA